MKNYKTLFIALFILSAFTATLQAGETEYLNSEVLAFARDNMGKTIGRGECWDLAAQPLKALGASWDGIFAFGKLVGRGDLSGLKLEAEMQPMPGDIIHFSRVNISWTKKYPDGSSEWSSETLGMPDHVAFLKEFDGKTVLTLLHQNVDGKRYLVETKVDFANIKSGSFIIYRPWREKKIPSAVKP